MNVADERCGSNEHPRSHGTAKHIRVEGRNRDVAPGQMCRHSRVEPHRRQIRSFSDFFWKCEYIAHLVYIKHWLVVAVYSRCVPGDLNLQYRISNAVAVCWYCPMRSIDQCSILYQMKWGVRLHLPRNLYSWGAAPVDGCSNSLCPQQFVLCKCLLFQFWNSTNCSLLQLPEPIVS